jgi:hypothetical protein
MHRITGSGLLNRGLLGLLAGVIAPLAVASAALAAPSVTINSFTYNPNDSTHQALILKATNTGANPLTTFAIQLARNGTASNAALMVGTKSYSSYCQAQNGGNTFPAIQCNIPSGVLPAQTAFTVSFAMSPAYPANQTQIWFAGDKTGANEADFTGPTPAASSPPPPQPPPPPSPPPPPKPCSAITVSPAALSSATVGQPYSQTITASGGTAPYTFRTASGSPPPGTSMGTDGAVAGTPSAPGTYAFTVDTTDAKGCSGTRSYSVDVAQAAAAPCSCSRMTLKLRPVLRGVHLSPHKHSFSIRFTWRTTCTGGVGGCKGKMSFATLQVMTGSKPAPHSGFQLTLKRQTFGFAGRAHKTMRGGVRIVVHSRRQLRSLFGHSLLCRIVVTHGTANAVETVRIRVTPSGYLDTAR